MTKVAPTRAMAAGNGNDVDMEMTCLDVDDVAAPNDAADKKSPGPATTSSKAGVVGGAWNGRIRVSRCTCFFLRQHPCNDIAMPGPWLPINGVRVIIYNIKPNSRPLVHAHPLCLAIAKRRVRILLFNACCVQAKTRMVGMLGSAKNNVSSYYGRPVVVDEASGTPTQILLASCTSLHAYVTNHGTYIPAASRLA